MNTAWKALFFLVEGLDLEIHICYTVDSFHSVQETLDVYSVQDNILGTETYPDKQGGPSVVKCMSEPHGLQMSGVCCEWWSGHTHM